MPDPRKSDHWDLLASELGAERAPEDVAEEPAASGERPEAVPEPPPPKAPSRGVAKPPRRAPNWDALASQLGVAPEIRAEEPLPAERPTEEPPEEASREGPAEASEAAESSLESEGQFRDFFQEPAAEVLEGPARPAWGPADAAEESDEPPPGGAGIDEETEEKKPARRRRKRRRKPRESSQAPDQPDLESAGEGSEAFSEEPAEAEPEVKEGQADKGRSKRRRKRSSGQKKRGLATDEAPPEEETATEQREKEKQTSQGTADKARKSTKHGDEEDEPDEDPKSSKLSHRTIPTWEETVGLIISANLEARSSRPAGGYPRGRGKARESAKAQGSSEKTRHKRRKRS